MNVTPTQPVSKPWRTAGLLLLIIIKLILITAMANRNISDFVYQGF